MTPSPNTVQEDARLFRLYGGSSVLTQMPGYSQTIPTVRSLRTRSEQ
jgi:hypothetical protein